MSATTTVDAEGALHTGAPIAFALAAQAGDLTAMQAAADWFRERGLPAHPTDWRFPSDDWKAYCVEVYKAQQDDIYTRARLVRALLSKLPESVKKPKGARGRMPAQRKLEAFFARFGIPVRVLPPPQDGAPCRVFVPTDHTQEDETRASLVSLYAAHFRGGDVQVVFDNGLVDRLMLAPAYAGERWLMQETYPDDEFADEEG